MLLTHTMIWLSFLHMESRRLWREWSLFAVPPPGVASRENPGGSTANWVFRACSMQLDAIECCVKPVLGISTYTMIQWEILIPPDSEVWVSVELVVLTLQSPRVSAAALWNILCRFTIIFLTCLRNVHNKILNTIKFFIWSKPLGCQAAWISFSQVLSYFNTKHATRTVF